MHVDTKEKSIILSCGNIMDMIVCGVVLEQKEAYALVDVLFGSANVYTHIWSDHDFVIWDNRLCMHSGPDLEKIVGDRVMQRVRLNGHPRCQGDYQI